MDELPIEGTTPAVLYAALQTRRRVRIDGWSLWLDDAGIWLTNPYGVDDGLVAGTESGASLALMKIRSRASEIREWC